MLSLFVCVVCGSSTHQRGFDPDALGRLESKGQIPALRKNKSLAVQRQRNAPWFDRQQIRVLTPPNTQETAEDICKPQLV